MFNSWDTDWDNHSLVENKPRETNQAEVGKKYVVLSMVLDLKLFIQFDQVHSSKKKKKEYFF